MIDVVHAALAAEDPISALRTATLELSARHGSAAARGALCSVCEELSAKGRHEEAVLVADMIDVLDEWRA
jgi:hypothetical protein